MEKIYDTPQPRICACGCGRIFTPTGWAVSQGKGIYFSKECAAKVRGSPPVLITCLCGCGRQRYVQASQVKEGWGKFFSKECASKWKAEQREKTKRVCACGCGREFYPEKNQKETPGWGLYATRKCAGTALKIRFLGENHPRYVEKIDVSCAYCGKIKKMLPSDVARNAARGGGRSFCNSVCRSNWLSDNIRGENHANFNPDKQIHYNGFTPKAKKRCRDFWGRVCFITGVPESENINPSGIQEELTCHHIDGNKESLLLVPILRAEHNRLEGNVKNKTGNPEEAARLLLENLKQRLILRGYTLDQYVSYLYTGIEKQTSLGDEES